MFVQRGIYYPASVGRSPQLLALLEERMQTRNAQGIPSGLMRQVFGPDGPAFITLGLFPALAANFQFRDRNQRDEGFWATQAKLDQVLARPFTMELWEFLVPTAPAVDTRLNYRGIFFPALGKEAELRAVLEERVTARQAEGISCNLQSRLFGPDGESFALTLRFPSGEAFEQYRERNQSDPAIRAFQTKTRNPELVRRPARFELYDIVVGVPAPK